MLENPDRKRRDKAMKGMTFWTPVVAAALIAAAAAMTFPGSTAWAETGYSVIDVGTRAYAINASGQVVGVKFHAVRLIGVIGLPLPAAIILQQAVML